jgi:hypothetical protein
MIGGSITTITMALSIGAPVLRSFSILPRAYAIFMRSAGERLLILTSNHKIFS